MTRPLIAIVIASTRPGRKGDSVTQWVLQQAAQRQDATFEIIDLAEVDLPPLDEPVPPASGRYTHAHTRAWAETVARYSGYIFVTPEYNHGYPGSLKNALDRVYAEWNNKVAGFVGYGTDGATYAVEQLRQVVTVLKMADVSSSVALSLNTDFSDLTHLNVRDHQAAALIVMLDEIVGRAKQPDELT